MQLLALLATVSAWYLRCPSDCDDPANLILWQASLHGYKLRHGPQPSVRKGRTYQWSAIREDMSQVCAKET